MFDFENFLKQIVEMDVSDIHLRVNEAPVVRKNGIMIKTNLPPLSKVDLDDIVADILPEKERKNINNIYNFD